MTLRLPDPDDYNPAYDDDDWPNDSLPCGCCACCGCSCYEDEEE